MYKEQRQKEMRETLRQTDKVSWSVNDLKSLCNQLSFYYLQDVRYSVSWAETVQIRMEFILSWMCICCIVYLFFCHRFHFKE